MFLDVSYGHLFMQNRNVTNSRVLLPAAIQPLPQDHDPRHYAVGDRPAIGNGKYVMEANFVGLGLRWLLDAPTDKPSPAAAPPVATPGPAPTESPAPATGSPLS